MRKQDYIRHQCSKVDINWLYEVILTVENNTMVDISALRLI